MVPVVCVTGHERGICGGSGGEVVEGGWSTGSEYGVECASAGKCKGCWGEDAQYKMLKCFIWQTT